MPSKTNAQHVADHIKRVAADIDRLAQLYVIEARKNGVPTDEIEQVLLSKHLSAYVALTRIADLAGTIGLEYELIENYRQPSEYYPDMGRFLDELSTEDVPF